MARHPRDRRPILLIPPWFENLGKRLIKSPKLYIADSGLACHLLGIETERELGKSPFLGALFEGLVASEIVKAQTAAGRRRELYWFRDQQGLEVDFLMPLPGGGVRLVEAKATATPLPQMALPMQRLAASWRTHTRPTGTIEMLLVHQPRRGGAPAHALAPGVRALPWREFARNALA